MEARESERESARPRLRLLAFPLALLAWHLWLEFRAPGMHGVDGYYHVKLARLYATGRLSLLGSDFPWTTCSLLEELRCDWQLGYHLLLVPFLAFGSLLAGKLSAALFAALIPVTVHAVLRAHRVRHAWACAVLLAVASEYYLVRVHLPRPTSPLVVLLLVATHLGAAARWRAFFGVLLGSLVLYCVPQNAVAVAVAVVLGFAAAERRLVLRPLGLALAAIALGVLLQPGAWHWRGGFPGGRNALLSVWEQMAGSLRASSDGDRVLVDDRWVELAAPAEFRPPSAEDLAGDFAPTLVLGAAVVLLLAGGRGRSRAAVAAGALAVLYGALFLRHVRFVEYALPFLALAAGLAAAPGPPSPAVGAGRRTRAFGLGLLAAAGVLFVVRAPGTLGSSARFLATDTGLGLRYEAPMAWLAEHTDEGEVVFHARWPQFCPMFYFDDRNRYLVGLDPYFFFMEDAREYERWVRLSRGELSPPDTVAGIAAFDARFALVKRDTELDVVLRRSRALPVYEDAWFRIWRVDGAAGGG